MGQNRQLGGEIVFLEDGFDPVQILPRTDQTFPKLFLDAPLEADVSPQFPPERGRSSVTVRLKQLDDFLVLSGQLLRIGAVSPDFLKELLPFFFPLFQLFVLTFVLNVISPNSFGKANHLVDQANIVLVMDQDFSVPVVGKDGFPKFDLVFKALGGE